MVELKESRKTILEIEMTCHEITFCALFYTGFVRGLETSLILMTGEYGNTHDYCQTQQANVSATGLAVIRFYHRSFAYFDDKWNSSRQGHPLIPLFNISRRFQVRIKEQLVFQPIN
jgi:hypothetical protein